MTASCISRFPFGAGRRVLHFLTAAIALLIVGAAVPALHAQVLYGSVTGTVSDKTGAVVPSVTVTLTNQGTGEVRAEKANAQGVYSVLDVLPGVYTLSIPQTGNFAGYTQKNIGIEVNQQVRLDVALQPATVSTEITVTEAPAEL
jgi:Carboxypeptidase regulatory-like domain